MKICGVIAEYNPLHLGHIKQIDYIKNTLKAQKLVVITSGNFTQRGEPAILNKYKRARHAIIAGADAVIELPAVFATANAETFAKGAVGILNGLNAIDGLCFGVESGEKEEYIALAKAMNSESKEFKKALKEQLEKGVSLAKAKFLALKETGGEFNEELINSPNNILGLEYTKALLDLESDINIYPMLRTGDHNDKELKKGITSATSIREALKADLKKKVKKSVPPYVYEDLGEYPFAFDKLIMAAVLSCSKERLAKIPDCTEGLENRIKALSKDNKRVADLIEKASTKRYPATRISRILINNLLGIDGDIVYDCLKTPPYAKILAVNGNDKSIISELTANAKIPVLTRKSDVDSLKKTAARCFEIDTLATELYDLAANESSNENQTLFV